MKIRILITTICISFLTLFYQNHAHAFEFNLGPKFGFGAGFFSGGDWDNIRGDNENNILFSFSLGPVFDMNFYQGNIFGIGIQPEVLYTRTGGGTTILWAGVSFQLNAIEIPIFLKPRFKAGKGYFFILTGPDLLLAIEKKYHVSGGGNQDLDTDNTFSLGISAGLGYEFPAGPGMLAFSLTYTTYFTGFWDGTTYPEKIYNNMIHLNASYAFMIVK